MKKFIFLILTFAYLASTSGATIYIHQCMGKTIAWDILENEGNSCAKCGMHKNAPNDCCKDHVKVLKVHYDQNLPESYLNHFLFSNAVLPVNDYPDFQSNFSTKKIENTKSFIPPRNKIGYCILFCTFLI